MPQMSPLFWLSLFVLFLFTTGLFLLFNYFLKPYKLFTKPSLYYVPLKPSWKL
uniref:ATP synthase F0 subunit 8 n=1 Tax=Indochinamon bhumibol TaxID=2771976 RepID=A0A7H9SVR4_9EUCA|nr:ATP synthase F0 subunit 8 [Indochinamon bhumibol]QNT10756.1 ATP synthase F0 subunit 8 [Indochinamon bhumibol]BCL51418.1 ATP synthase F0 subunit 8 [Indochinamon bhumibol]